MKTLVLGLLLVTTITAQSFRQFEDYGASVIIPDGFVEAEPARVTDGLTALYIKGDPNDDVPDLGFSIQFLPGTLAPNTHLSASDFSKEVQDLGFYVERMNWGDHAVDVIRGSVVQEGIEVSSIVVQIPLEPNALQLNFAAPSERIEELEAIAQQTLASVVGSTNWDGIPRVRKMTTSERVVSGIKGTVQLALVCIGAILLVRAFRKKRSTTAASASSGDPRT